MSSGKPLNVKLTIKRKTFEVSVEGAVSDLETQIDELATFLDEVEEKVGTNDIEEEPQLLPAAEESAEMPSEEMPIIKPTKSTIENIRLLFDTPWGRSPHTASEVLNALEVNAVYDRVEAVSTNLSRLVRKGVLRRLSKGGKWAYVRVPGE
jgi:hypothetical protein